MSIFLERQKVRKRKAMTRWFRLVERVLLSVVIVFGGVLILYGFYLLVFLGSVFSIYEITVEGRLTHVTTEKVVELSHVKLGQSLFGIDVASIYDSVREFPWVNRVAVRRRLPHTLWMYIEEYVPAAIAQGTGGLSFVDQDGVIFKSVEPMDPKTFPVLSGIPADDPHAEQAKLKEMLSLLKLYQNSSFGQQWGVSEIHLSDKGTYDIVTERGPVRVVLGQDAAARLSLLDRWQGVISRKGGRMKYILANDEKRLTVGYN